MSLALRLLILASRLAAKPVLARAPDPLPLRDRFARFARRAFPPPPYTLAAEIALAPGLGALAISNRPGSRPPRRGRAILYFHGGAFIAGSPRTHAALLARLARLTRTEVIAPAYRLAPEHPFPAAVADARAAWEGLRARGLAPGDIVIGGDSAGGNLALGLLAALLAEGIRPAGLVAFSPAADLTFSGASIAANAAADPVLPASRVDDLRRFYLGPDGDPADPRASPLCAAFPAPPPAFLQVARSEILLDDSLRLAARLRAEGGAVTLDEWPDAPHVFAMFERWVPEARQALERAAAFVTALWDEADQAKAASPASR